jgi:hypothetical protein
MQLLLHPTHHCWTVRSMQTQSHTDPQMPTDHCHSHSTEDTALVNQPTYIRNCCCLPGSLVACATHLFHLFHRACCPFPSGPAGTNPWQQAAHPSTPLLLVLVSVMCHRLRQDIPLERLLPADSLSLIWVRLPLLHLQQQAAEQAHCHSW